MHLKSLELSGFKSFAKKSELTFDTPIAGIVGPNGSGKSNVAEAFRFVLGEQSIKSLRGKRGEDLIFNGTQDISRANRASVKVVFDNSRRFLNVDFDEVALERIVHRDGNNEYFINGTQVRLKDIVELLASAHIGPSGHHIISQGEADRILNTNIRERKEMIEDALGLKLYQWKRSESTKKLEKTEINIREVELLRKEIAPHLKFLKKQVEKVEKTAAMRSLLRDLYKDYLKREWMYVSHTIDEIEKKKKEPEEKLKKLDNDLTEATKILSESKNADEKSQELVFLERELSRIQTEKNTVVRDIGRLEGELSLYTRMLNEEEKREDVSVQITEVEDLTSQVQKNIDSLAGQDSSFILQTIENIKKLFSDFFAKHRGGKNDARKEGIEIDIERTKSDKLRFETKLAELVKKEEESSVHYRTLKEEIEKEKDSSRDAEKNVFRIRAERNEINTILGEIHSLEERIKLERVRFEEELKEGSVLVGPVILEYKQHNPEGDVISEDRTKQEARRKEIEKIKIRLEDAGSGTGEDVLKEYKEVTERDAFLEKELIDLHNSAESLKQLILELGEKLENEFKEGIKKINTEFQNFFALMFGGGTASLNTVKRVKRKRADSDMSGLDDEEARRLMEEELEEEEGVDINVSLPRKKIRGLEMLSGGERALTSIALIFAMSRVNPPPFIILDETDAALDEANSRKYGDMVELLSKESQLILITHNRETMAHAGVLYGVTMVSGISKLLSIKFEEAVSVAK